MAELTQAERENLFLTLSRNKRCPTWFADSSKEEKYAFYTSKTSKKIVKKYINRCVKKKIQGELYEASVVILFHRHNKQNYWYFPNKEKIENDCMSTKSYSLTPDGGLLKSVGNISKGILEIKGFSHLMTGSADEKNCRVPSKYMYYPLKKGHKVSVILCGKLTTCNQKLINLTNDYHNYLNGKEYSKLHKPEYDMWIQYNFNGYFTFSYLEITLKNM
jgi:hypothetical protein